MIVISSARRDVAKGGTAWHGKREEIHMIYVYVYVYIHIDISMCIYIYIYISKQAWGYGTTARVCAVRQV